MEKSQGAEWKCRFWGSEDGISWKGTCSGVSELALSAVSAMGWFKALGTASEHPAQRQTVWTALQGTSTSLNVPVRNGWSGKGRNSLNNPYGTRWWGKARRAAGELREGSDSQKIQKLLQQTWRETYHHPGRSDIRVLNRSRQSFITRLLFVRQGIANTPFKASVE